MRSLDDEKEQGSRVRYAVVTGAGSGIGRAVAIALSQRFSVALLGRDATRLAGTATQCDGQALQFPADVTDPAGVSAVFRTLREDWGRLDLLFNNAGTNVPTRPIDEHSAEELHDVISSNLLGALYCSREAFAIMRTQQPTGGRIINNGSVAAYSPRPGSPAYTAAKHGMTGLTKSLILDGSPFGISCCQVDIGNAATARTERVESGVPQADGTVRREPRLSLDVVVRHIVHLTKMPPESCVAFSTILPVGMPLFGRG